MKYQIVAVMVSLAVMTPLMAAAEDTIPSCASKLTECVNYMNSTAPPSTCCTPLKAAIETELDCLCNLYNTPGLLKSVGIDIDQARQLPTHCKLASDLSACSNTTKSSAPSPKTAAPAAPANDGSAKIAWTSFSGGLLLLASTICY